MSLKIVPVDDEIEVDVELCFVTTPPTATPVSARAREWFALPEGCEGAIMCGTAEETLGTIPGEFVLANSEDPPSIVAIVAIAPLH